MTEQDKEGTMIKWLKDYVIPASAALVVATGAWVRQEVKINALSKQLEENSRTIERVCAFGPTGFSDPSSHVAHDLHCEHYLKQLLGRQGWRKFQQDYGNGGAGNK